MSRSKPWRLAQAFFLAAGLLAVGYAAYAYAALSLYQEFASRSFDRVLASHALKPPSLNPPQQGTMIGRIVVPRLDISAIVKEGVDAKTLRVAVGHIPGTALPGRPGNVGVSAHRDTLFRNLKDARLNDEITLTSPDGEYRYLVVSLAVVEPGDVSVLAPSDGQQTLTLVTCYPFYYVGNAPKRFVVRALQLTGHALHPTIASTVAGAAIAPMPIAIHFDAEPLRKR